MPRNQAMAEHLDAPADPIRFLSLLVLARALDDAAGMGCHLTTDERRDAVDFVRGDWRTRLWCDAAGVEPEQVQRRAVIAPPPPERTRRRKLTAETAAMLRAEAAAGVSRAELALRYGVCRRTARECILGLTWREEVTT